MSLRPIAGALAGLGRGFTSLPARSGPLETILAAWPGIVGAHIATHSAPLEISGRSLIVATRSSAWSQQLQFLEPQILSAVRAIPSAAHLERLTFRSGALRARAAVALPPRPKVRASGYTVELEPARDLAEALARLRSHFAARARQSDRLCERCGGGLRGRAAETRFCAPCEATLTGDRLHATQRLLYETPWFSRDAVLDLVPELTHDEYDRARRLLLTRWWGTLERARRSKAVSRDGIERRIATSYVILRARLPPDRISPAIVRNVLGDELAALLFGEQDTPRAESHVRSAKTPRR